MSHIVANTVPQVQPVKPAQSDEESEESDDDTGELSEHSSSEEEETQASTSKEQVLEKVSHRAIYDLHAVSFYLYLCF